MISLNVTSYFTPPVVEKLKKNLEALENVKPGIQLLNSETEIYLDNRWGLLGTPPIKLDPKAISWTFKNMHFALQAAKSLGESRVKDRKSINENFDLLCIAGKVRMSCGFYFNRINDLRSTYRSMDGGKELVEALNKIKKKYKPRLKAAIKELTASEYQRQNTKEEIPEIDVVNGIEN